MAAVYTVRTTLNPGVAYQVDQSEYELLDEQGLVAALDAVSVSHDKVIVSPVEPVAPAFGQVWFDTTVGP